MLKLHSWVLKKPKCPRLYTTLTPNTAVSKIKGKVEIRVSGPEVVLDKKQEPLGHQPIKELIRLWRKRAEAMPMCWEAGSCNSKQKKIHSRVNESR